MKKPTDIPPLRLCDCAEACLIEWQAQPGFTLLNGAGRVTPLELWQADVAGLREYTRDEVAAAEAFLRRLGYLEAP